MESCVNREDSGGRRFSATLGRFMAFPTCPRPDIPLNNHHNLFYHIRLLHHNLDFRRSTSKVTKGLIPRQPKHFWGLPGENAGG